MGLRSALAARRVTGLVTAVTTAVAIAAAFGTSAITAVFAEETIRVVLPDPGQGLAGSDGKLIRGIRATIEDFEKQNADIRVRLTSSTSSESGLRDVLTMGMAGTGADLAWISYEERLLARNALGKNQTFKVIPYLRTVPVILVNDEILFRHRLDTAVTPKTMKDWIGTFAKLAEKPSGAPGGATRSLTLSTRDEEGFWILTSLLGREPWERTDGGLRTHRLIPKRASALKQLLQQHAHWNPELSPEAALDLFLDGKVCFFVTSAHRLALLGRPIEFRTHLIALPTWDTAESAPIRETDLWVIHPRPSVLKLVQALTEPKRLSELQMTSGFFPERLSKLETPPFFGAQDLFAAWTRLARTTRTASKKLDPDYPQARTKWGRALNDFLALPLDASGPERQAELFFETVDAQPLQLRN